LEEICKDRCLSQRGAGELVIAEASPDGYLESTRTHFRPAAAPSRARRSPTDASTCAARRRSRPSRWNP